MVELAEDEVNKFCKAWAIIFASLCYCYSVGKLIPKGLPRLLAILPIVLLFLLLPLNLTSFHLGGLTAFFIAWLANFKLLLFAFGKPPLSPSHSSLSFPHFIAFACLPIRNIHQDPTPESSVQSENSKNPNQKPQHKPCPSPQNPPETSKSVFNYIIKSVLLLAIIRICDYSDYIHPKVLWLIYLFQIYLTLEIVFNLLAKSVNSVLGCELEPQFREPLLSRSLQDFWGRRWNLMVTRILRPTVYLPTLEFSAKMLGRKWAALPAVLATFVVSGAMHELIFYYLGHLRPTLEVTAFFLLHGLCLCLEMAIKKATLGRTRRVAVPPWVSGPATVVFVVATGFWLFLPPLLRAGLATRSLQEYAAFGRFLRGLWRSISDY